MVAQGHLPVSLPHLVVSSCTGDAQRAIGFLQRDIYVWLPSSLLPLITVEVVICAMTEGEVYGGTTVHGVDEPPQQEPEQQPAATTQAPTNEGEDNLNPNKVISPNLSPP